MSRTDEELKEAMRAGEAARREFAARGGLTEDQASRIAAMPVVARPGARWLIRAGSRSILALTLVIWLPMMVFGSQDCAPGVAAAAHIFSKTFTAMRAPKPDQPPTIHEWKD